MIERLKTLSDLTKDQLLGENSGSKALRFHPIDWAKTPFKKSDLKLPKVIEENDYAFAIMQTTPNHLKNITIKSVPQPLEYLKLMI